MILEVSDFVRQPAKNGMTSWSFRIFSNFYFPISIISCVLCGLCVSVFRNKKARALGG